MFLASILSVGCLLAVVALLWADHRDNQFGRVLAKLTASSCFIGVALVLGALDSVYGRWILLALALGWIGDAFLLSSARKAFLGGLAAFWLSHVAFGLAFSVAQLSLPALAIAGAIALAFGAVVLRWLMPRTPQEFKAPVVAYIVVILIMCTVAAGHAIAQQRWAVLLGAVMFAASDISVAREKFVQQSQLNQLWGWPAYFAAQVILAWTIL